MSIEKNLERIATATEAILAMMQGVKLAEPSVTKVEVITPEMQKVVTNVAPAPSVAEPTEEELRAAVREYMNANGKEKAIEMLIKHGANKEKPMIKDVTNKIGLMKEIKNG